MQLFDVLNPDFFKPLSGCNKQEFADLITLIWELCKRSPTYSIEKSTILDQVYLYFSGVGPFQLSEIDFDDGSNVIDAESAKDPRLLATAFVRRLKNTGWLEELEGGYEEEPRIAVNHRIIPIISSFDDVLHPKLITYKGKLFKVFTLLEAVDKQESPYENVLREVSSDMDDLNNALRQLNASIGDYLDELTRNKTPQEVLELFNQYEEKVVVAAYHRFKTSDNLFYYKSSLLEQLDYCESAYFMPLVEDYLTVEQTSRDDAMVAIRNLVRKIREDVQEMSNIISKIDERHILYRSRAVQRAQFLLLSDGSIKGKINQLLKYYSFTLQNGGDVTVPDDTIVSQCFKLCPQNGVGRQFLCSPVSSKRPTPIEPLLEQTPLSREEIEGQQELLLLYARSAVTTENVNRFAVKALQKRQAVTASVLAAETPEEFVKIIGLHTYSSSTDRNYEIKLKPEWVVRNGVRFQDFILQRRN